MALHDGGLVSFLLSDSDMSVQSLRVVRLFLWGVLIVALLTVGTMYLLRGTLLKGGQAKPAALVNSEARDLKPLGAAPKFALTNQDGETFDISHNSGKVYVVDFFFTQCAGICPKLQKNMKQIQDAFIGNDSVRLVSISVDPENDTPSVLAGKAKDLGADPEIWQWTVGPTTETGRIAKEMKLVGTEVPGDILHSNRFVLVDGYGKVRGYYDGTDQNDVDAIIKDIGRLLGE